MVEYLFEASPGEAIPSSLTTEIDKRQSSINEMSCDVTSTFPVLFIPLFLSKDVQCLLLLVYSVSPRFPPRQSPRLSSGQKRCIKQLPTTGLATQVLVDGWGIYTMKLSILSILHLDRQLPTCILSFIDDLQILYRHHTGNIHLI